MATQTDPRERPEIRTTDDLLTAVRVGLEIATRSDIYESEHRVVERIDERMDARFEAQNARIDARFDAQDARFEAQNARIDARFDAQDARMDSFETRLNENTAATNENAAAIRELAAAAKAERRGKDRAIQWLSIGLAVIGSIAGVLGVVVAAVSS